MLSQALTTLPILDLDHPGAQDPLYRQRRHDIAQAAILFHRQPGKKIPLIIYTQKEHALWRRIFSKLRPLHKQHACSLYKEGFLRLSITAHEIPQLSDLSDYLEELNGFRLEPIHGLVDPQVFLSFLSKKVMLSTQYIRHASRPEFTPEPDIVHEFLGHMPLFTCARLNAFQQLIGQAAAVADEQELESISKLYWFTIEYGLIQEKDGIKALGAGLLGGIKDFTNAFTGKVKLQHFDLQKVIATDSNYSFEQTNLFIIPSLDELEKQAFPFLQAIIDRK